MNVCEDREYLNHKDREEESAQRRKCSPEYREYERESTRRSRKRKCPPDEQPLEEGGEKAGSREDVSRRVHGARCSMFPCMSMSGGRVHGRKHASVQHGCWSTRDLDKDRRVQKYILANKSASALREVVHTSSEANIGATRS